MADDPQPVVLAPPDVRGRLDAARPTFAWRPGRLRYELTLPPGALNAFHRFLREHNLRDWRLVGTEPPGSAEAARWTAPLSRARGEPPDGGGDGAPGAAA